MTTLKNKLNIPNVEKMSAEFTELIANPPKVSYRDGHYFVFDGQHTIVTRRAMNGGQDLPIICKVYEGLTEEEEAMLFSRQTGVSTPLTAGAELRAALVGKDPESLAFVKATESTGLQLGLDSYRAPWKIICIRTAFKEYKAYGADLYKEALTMLANGWEGDPDSLRSGILQGMVRFVALYQGEYDPERLVKRLHTVHPMTLVNDEKSLSGTVSYKYMASIKLIEPKKKPRYYQITANVLVNGKIERRYGRFDFDPTELKNARARNAAANAAAAEFERQEQEKADKEASNAGKTFAVVAQEYIASNRSRMAPSVRLKGDYDANRNKENTSLKKEKYLQRIQSYPEFSEKAIGTITRQDCDAVIRFLEDSDARVYKRAVLKPESKEFKTVSCPKIAKNCTIREETIERIFRGEKVSLDSAQQVAMALGKTVEQMFEVEIDRRPMTKKTMREYNLFIRSVLNYANDNYGTSLQMPMIKASGRKGKSVDCLHSDEVEALQAALKECSMLEKAIVLCLLNTGVRRGELAGLTWKDVNFRDGTIHVSKSLLVFPNYGYQLTTTKESNIRDVDVAPEFMAFLKDYHEQWKSRKKLMGASWQKNLEKKGAKYAQSLLDLRGNDFVICNDYGFPINPDSYAALVRRVGKKAGIEKIHPHMFRHTFVSILLSNPNIGVATVAAEAGHAQPSTTLAIYTQVYDRRRDEIRKQMSKELYK